MAGKAHLWNHVSRVCPRDSHNGPPIHPCWRKRDARHGIKQINVAAPTFVRHFHRHTQVYDTRATPDRRVSNPVLGRRYTYASTDPMLYRLVLAVIMATQTRQHVFDEHPTTLPLNVFDFTRFAAMMKVYSPVQNRQSAVFESRKCSRCYVQDGKPRAECGRASLHAHLYAPRSAAIRVEAQHSTARCVCVVWRGVRCSGVGGT